MSAGPTAGADGAAEGEGFAARAAARVSPATRAALLGACSAMAAGITLGGVARAARGAGVGTEIGAAVARSAPARLAAAAPDAWSRLVASLDGTAPMFAELGLLAALALTLVVAAGALGRALVLRRRARRARRPVGRATPAAPAPLPAPAAPSRPRFTLRLPARTPAEPVRALAGAGLQPAEIARRTGLSRDAVALAVYLN